MRQVKGTANFFCKLHEMALYLLVPGSVLSLFLSHGTEKLAGFGEAPVFFRIVS